MTTPALYRGCPSCPNAIEGSPRHAASLITNHTNRGRRHDDLHDPRNQEPGQWIKLTLMTLFAAPCGTHVEESNAPTRDVNGLEWLWSQGILVYPAILHNNLKVLGGIGYQVDILQRIPVDQQQIGKRALFHDAELARIRTAFAGQC
jgi:hypothetical protein